MARERDPKREQNRRVWLDSNGELTIKQIAAQVDASESTVRKWKSLDKWADELGSSGADGRSGNANAAGHGAPQRNQNASTHGAYSTMHLDNLPESTRLYVEQVSSDSMERSSTRSTSSRTEVRAKI